MIDEEKYLNEGYQYLLYISKQKELMCGLNPIIESINLTQGIEPYHILSPKDNISVYNTGQRNIDFEVTYCEDSYLSNSLKAIQKNLFYDIGFYEARFTITSPFDKTLISLTENLRYCLDRTFPTREHLMKYLIGGCEELKSFLEEKCEIEKLIEVFENADTEDKNLLSIFA